MFRDIMSTDNRDDDETAGVDYDEIGFDHKDMSEDAPFEHEDILFDTFGDGSHTPIITDPKDGLPRPADDWVAPAPKMDVATFICIEDESEFVEVFLEDVSGKSVLLESLTYKTDKAREILKGRRSRFDDKGRPILPRRFKPDVVTEVYGMKVATILGGQQVVVAPIRPRCSNLVRQITIADDIAGNGQDVMPMFSFCKAFKSVSGAYLSIMDKAVLACEHRTPRDLITEQMIVDRIRRKIKEGQERVQVPIAAPVPLVDPFEGERSFDRMNFFVKANPKFAPGNYSSVSMGPPSKYDGAEEMVLYVGKDIQSRVFEEKNPDVKFHTLFISQNDYAPEGVGEDDLKSFCESWPSFASYPYLSTNLISTPRMILDMVSRGKSVYVCAKDERDARFAFNLLRKELGYTDFTGPMRPEHVHYLNRKDSLCQKTKDPRESPSARSPFLSQPSPRPSRRRMQLLSNSTFHRSSTSTPPSTPMRSSRPSRRSLTSPSSSTSWEISTRRFIRDTMSGSSSESC